ncbi:hypothetical protein [Lacrimispora xylanisolvens]|uniref:hypothetical protein n=1 Tax=Lacrimispora xylanisolvens TaxID=384636 RepID=UPI002402AA66
MKRKITVMGTMVVLALTSVVLAGCGKKEKEIEFFSSQIRKCSCPAILRRYVQSGAYGQWCKNRIKYTCRSWNRIKDQAGEK